MTPQTASFMSPGFNYGADIAEIERQRRLAQALQEQSLQPMGPSNEMAGGWVVRRSPFEGAGKLAQALAATHQFNQTDEKQRQLSSKAQQDLTGVLTRAGNAYAGRPAIDQPSDEVGGGPGRGALPSNPREAANIYMSHPQTAPLGMQVLQTQVADDSRKQKLADALKLAGGGGQGGGPSGGQPGGMNLGALPPQIVALLTSGDQELVKLATTMIDANKGVALRPGAPLVNPITGAVMAQPAPAVPQGMQLTMGAGGNQASVIPGYQGAQTQLNSTPNPSAAMVKLNTSSGQEIQLTQPEYLQYQQSGQLPQRFGQQAPQAAPQPSPAAQPPQQAARIDQQFPTADAARSAAMEQARLNPNQPFSFVGGKPNSLGVVGATQTQDDKIRQDSQRAANTEAGKAFIKEMSDNFSKLRDVPASLGNIERAKTLALGQAGQFMGPLGESKLAITKFFRSNIPGMSNINTEGVTSAEELRASLFNQVMDNLKKMDSQPSQYQQQVMQQAFGTLGTDPQSIPKMLDVFADILKNRVDIHNEQVQSAEGRGTAFPYDVRIKMPAKQEPGKGAKPTTASPNRSAVDAALDKYK